jgi:thiol-disulfide isomerase/thioredoxin
VRRDGGRDAEGWRLSLLGALLALALSAGAVLAGELPEWTGGPTPPLALADLDGRPHDLARYRGRAVLVNFWATWCPPCRDELPSLERLAARLADRPFAALLVNVAEGEGRVRRFLAEHPLTLPVLLDRRGQAQRDWRLRGLPASFLLDAEGRIRRWQMGELDWAAPAVVRTVESLLPR